MKKVNVILPAYQGEEYIGEQIESLLRQTYPYVDIYIRDDHSSDRTVEIIRSYMGKEPEGKRIILIDNNNTNWGYVRNVFDTLKLTEPADFYCFSDQDDVWHDDKIEKCVKLLESKGNELPALCFTGFNYCYSDLSFMKKSISAPDHPELRQVCFDFIALNFNITINHAFREVLFNHLPTDGRYPDYPDFWMSQAAACYGRLYYLDEETVEYRRNKKAASYANHSTISMIIWQVRKFLFDNKESQQIARDLREIKNNFDEIMTPSDRKMMECFVHRSVLHYFQRVFFPRRLRRLFKDEVALRLMFLLGKFW